MGSSVVSTPQGMRAARIDSLVSGGNSPHGQKLFRPPYGEQSLGLQLDALRLGFRIVTWNLLTEDWGDDPPEQVMGRIRCRMAPDSIVLFHDAVYTIANEAWKDRSSTLGSVELLLREYGESLPLRHGARTARNGLRVQVCLVPPGQSGEPAQLDPEDADPLLLSVRCVDRIRFQNRNLLRFDRRPQERGGARPLVEYRMETAKDILEILFTLMTLGDDRTIKATYVMGECLYKRGW